MLDSGDNVMTKTVWSLISGLHQSKARDRHKDADKVMTATGKVRNYRPWIRCLTHPGGPKITGISCGKEEETKCV